MQPLRLFLLVALPLGILVAGARIFVRRRAKGAPPGARLNFPIDKR